MITNRRWDNFLDVIYPPVCLLCGNLSEGKYPHCCSKCRSEFHPIIEGYCTTCGIPFPVPDTPHSCLECIRKKLPFEWCRGLYLFSGRMSEAVHALKYGRKLSLAEVLKDAVAEAVSSMDIPHFDAVVPVPVSTWRLMKRGFNQAALLASPVADYHDVPLLNNALSRRGAKPQVGLEKAQRDENVKGAFYTGRDHKKLSGNRVLLFDDVYTTGATVRECCKVLKAAGAVPLVLTLARAGQDQSFGHVGVDMTISGQYF